MRRRTAERASQGPGATPHSRRKLSLFVVARPAHPIYEMSLSGEAQLLAGSGKKGRSDGPALETSFCYPNDIAIGPDGRTLYVNEVADESSGGMKLAPTRIRVIARWGGRAPQSRDSTPAT